MKKGLFTTPGIFIMILCFVITPMLSIFFNASDAMAAQQSAVINFNTSQITAIERNSRGYNSPMNNTALTFLDDDLINMTKNAKVGWMRFSGPNNAFNWKLGECDDESIVQFYPTKFYHFQDVRRWMTAKGNEHISDFYDLTSKTGAKIIMTVNLFTDTTGDIGHLAKFVKDNNMKVEYWQLGNEPYWWGYNDNSDNLIFSGVKDYLDKAKYFSDKIKEQLPDAKILVFYHPDPNKSFNDEIKNYSPRYWDGITFHQYTGGAGTTLDQALKNANSALANWENNINIYKQKSWSSVPMVVTEYGVEPGAYIIDSLYHGIYVTEAVLRASKFTNIKYMGGFRLADGLVKPGNDHLDALEDFYQKGQTVDTTGWNFNMYSQAPAITLKVADYAINNSSAIWNTTVTGGASVYKEDGTTMPAIYAQAYKGDNGKNYVVIVNKSNQSHDVIINQDGSTVSASMTKTYTASTNPTAKNTASNPNNLTIQTTSTANPVYIPEYSVVRVEWDARTATVLPTQLTHAQATASGEVSLKWWPLDGVANYNVKYGVSPGVYNNTVSVNNATETIISGLANGTTYYFTVCPETYSSVLSNELSVNMAVPAAPGLVNVYAKRKGELAVEWQSVPGALGYKVKYGTVSGSYTNTIDVGNVAGYKLTGLETNTQYFAVVRAYNGIGESSNSNELSDFTRNQQPYAPNDLHIKSTGNGSVTLEWEHSPAEFVYDGFEFGSNNWTVREGSFSLVDITRPVLNTTAKMYQSGNTTGYHVATSGQTWSEYEVESKIDMTGTTSGFAGVVGRYDAATNSYYRLVLSHADYSGYNDPNDDKKYFKIQRINNGTTKELNFQLDPVTNDEFTLGLKFHGNTLTVLFNGNIMGSITDTSPDAITTGGYAGIIGKTQSFKFDQFIIRRWNIDRGVYEIYRKTTYPYPAPGTLIGTVDGKSNTFTDRTIVSGQRYYYRVYGRNGDNNQDISFAPSNVIPYTAP